MRSIMLCNDAKSVHYVYSDEMLQQLAEIAGLDAEIYSRDAVLAAPEAFADVDYAFSTWGMPAFEEAEIQQIFPSLKAVFYGAGSVQAFARPFLNCGVKVFSAWAANAVPVAEYTVAQIVLANKGFFLTSRLHKAYDHEASYDIRRKYPGNYGASIGIIGAGMIGKLVIQMLKNYHLPVKVFDPFLPDETAAELGVPKCSLEEVFATCQVVSNHLANNAQTVGMLNGPLFASMLPYATFLNTGRGAQVVEADLAQVLADRPDLTAILDVTWPEPPEAGHPFYSLPNCWLTPHIAGSSGDEVHRMAEYMIEEFKNHVAGRSVQYEVNLEMLKTMA